jgi:hypothetical protein
MIAFSSVDPRQADPDTGTNATLAAKQAEQRYVDLVCHWAMWCELQHFHRPFPPDFLRISDKMWTY